MRRLVLLAAVICLASCEGEAAREDRKLEMLKQAGASGDELCNQSRKVEAAYLDAGDNLAFQQKKSEADNQCLRAQLDRIGGGESSNLPDNGFDASENEAVP